jgi:hypothetical protein
MEAADRAAMTLRDEVFDHGQKLRLNTSNLKDVD